MSGFFSCSISFDNAAYSAYNTRMEKTTFGEWLKNARLAKGRGLRNLAPSLEVTPSYLSDIENDRRIPAEDVLKRLAAALDLSEDDVMVRAGRFGEDTQNYIKREPEAIRLMRRIAEAKLTAVELESLIGTVNGYGR